MKQGVVSSIRSAHVHPLDVGGVTCLRGDDDHVPPIPPAFLCERHSRLAAMTYKNEGEPYPMPQTNKVRRKRQTSSFQNASFPFRLVHDTAAIRIEFHFKISGACPVIRDLTRLAGPISVESGCESCRIWMDYEDPKNMALSIGWCSEADLIRFVRSEKFLALMAILETGADLPGVFVSDMHRIRLTDSNGNRTFSMHQKKRKTS